MQLVTPSVVPTAVSTAIITCKIVFQTSFFIFFFPFFFFNGSTISFFLNFRKFFPTRPERAEAPSPGHRPGCLWTQACRPVRAKALKPQAKITKLLPLQGALLTADYTQGDALG